MIDKENIDESTAKILPGFKIALQQQQQHILNWWVQFSKDDEHGGFFGTIDHDNKPVPNAPKSLMMNCGILWAFSSAYQDAKNETYLQMARDAYEYINNHFIDPEFDGVYQTVTSNGEMLDATKQSQAQAFALYALSAYYACENNSAAKDTAIALYKILLQKCKDQTHGGFYEGFSRDWSALAEPQDGIQQQKSTKTQLQVLEGFAGLYSIWQDKGLEKEISNLLEIFHSKIIRDNYFYQHLFFETDWTPVSNHVSFGQDLASAWVLQAVSEQLHDAEQLEKMKYAAIKICHTASMGVGKDGGIWFEYFFEGHRVIKEKHASVQAEAMIGFFNAWQNSGEDKFLQQALHSYHFIHNYIIDPTNGEWVWGVHEDNSVMRDKEKAGITKYPLHNYRACTEIIRRIQNLIE